MTKEVTGLTVLRGTVRNLEVCETTVDAFQGDALRAQTGAAGVLAAAAGLSGIAAGMVGMSMDEMKEGAFGVSFEIDGEPVRGVLWNCFFEEGDEVEVVAEPLGGHWNVFAVARPRDRIIALFPHVVSGTIAHYKTAFSAWWKVMASLLAFSFSFIFLFALFSNIKNWSGLVLSMALGGGGAVVLFGIIGLNVARKYLPFVRIAEGVFIALGWQDAKRINLRKRTMKTIRPDDPPALGPFYFRY